MIRTPAETQAGIRAAGGDIGAYLTAALPDARRGAQAPISGFAVGAAGLGASGATYLGANIEQQGRPLHATLHAEEAAVRLAESRGDVVTRLATTAAPCGHCRHLLWSHNPELTMAPGDRPLAELLPWPPRVKPSDVGIPGLAIGPVARALVQSLAREGPAPHRLELSARLSGWDRQIAFEWAPEATLATPDVEAEPERFLPLPFGPRDLSIAGSPFDGRRFTAKLDEASNLDDLALAALRAAGRSWSPVTRSPSGVALRAGRGVAAGAFVESVAFNPSVTALAAALVALADLDLTPESIDAAVLVEAQGAAASYAEWTAGALARLAPGSSFRTLRASFDVLDEPHSGMVEP